MKSMFPAINVATVRLKECRRVVLFHLIEEEEAAEVVEGGKEDDEKGTVKFSFRYRKAGRDFSQLEIASFRRVDGDWRYDDSEVNPKSPPVRVEKVGRNDPCPCGSGKKFKKCCGG